MAYRATRRTETRKAEIRARILRQARQLIIETGFRGLTIAAVAARSEIATGTVYRYFSNKADLCVAVFELATEHEIDAVVLASQQGDTTLEQLTGSLTTFARRALRNPTLAYALIAEPVGPELEETRLRYRSLWADTFATLLEKGKDQRIFYSQPTYLSAAALVGAMAETIVISSTQQINRNHPNSDHANSQRKLSQTELCNHIVNFCLRAVVKTEVLI
ncbi:MAG: TetR/AcrR family transcriptional regulator [Ketobacter sp.]